MGFITSFKRLKSYCTVQRAFSACLLMVILIMVFGLLSYPLAIATVATLSLAVMSATLWRLQRSFRKTADERFIANHMKHLIDARKALYGIGYQNPAEALDSLVKARLSNLYYNTNPKTLIRQLTRDIQATNAVFNRRVRASAVRLGEFLPIGYIKRGDPAVQPSRIYEDAFSLYTYYEQLDEDSIMKSLFSVNLLDKKMRDQAIELIATLLRVDEYLELRDDLNKMIIRLESV